MTKGQALVEKLKDLKELFIEELYDIVTSKLKKKRVSSRHHELILGTFVIHLYYGSILKCL